MKIGMSAEWIGTNAGGLETYEESLIKALAAVDEINEYEIYVSYKDALSELSQCNSNVKRYYLGSSSRWYAFAAGIPWQLVKNPVNLFHALVVPPLFCPGKLIFTIHDLAYIEHPEWYPLLVRKRLAFMTWLGILKAEHIIAVSNATKNSIIDYYKIPESRITVIHEGADPIFRPIPESEERSSRLERHGIRSPFMLYVGRFHARKNLIRLVQAFARIRSELDPSFQLVLVGRDQYHGALVMDEIARLGLGEQVICPGHIPVDDLPYLYSAAELFVYPSLFEGFGLPPLEAMACGTPVAVSDRKSLPEVVGEAGVLFDPDNTEEIAKTLLDMLQDEVRRKELGMCSIEQASRFSWETAAMETLEVYRAINR